MPNRYSHAFVLSDYEKRGVFDSIYRRDIYRYHRPTHHHQLSSSSSALSSKRSSVSYHIETTETSVPTTSAAKTSPPRPASFVITQSEKSKQDSPPQPNPRPTTASPPSRTPSSVVTQIYKPQSPQSYFDGDSSQAFHPTASRPFSPSTELYTPLSPLPASLDYLDLDSSPGSEKTSPRSSVDGLTLGEMLLEAIPPSTVDRSTRVPYQDSDALIDEADDAVPPPISRHRPNNYSPKSSGHTQNLPRPLTPVPRTGSRQRTSFTDQAWSPPRPANINSVPLFSQSESPSPQPAATPSKKPTPSSQTYTNIQPKGNGNRPTRLPLQRTRTDLNAEEMQRWKNEVRQAEWRRGNWVGALVGLKGFAGRRGSPD